MVCWLSALSISASFCLRVFSSALAMRFRRAAKLASARVRRAAASACAAWFSAVQRARSLVSASSNCARSLRVRAPKSRSSSAARVTASRIPSRNRANNASTSAAPGGVARGGDSASTGGLLAVVVDSGEDAFKRVNVVDGLVHVGEQLVEKSFLELAAFGVVPVFLGVFPFAAEFFGEAHPAVLAGGDGGVAWAAL